jgi:hypothetical protein
MKTFQILLLILLSPILSACETDYSKDIRITVNNEWWVTVSPKGMLGIRSLVDSDPMAGVATKEGVIEYLVIKQKILQGQKLGDAKPEVSAIASLQDGAIRFLVSEEVLLDLLKKAGSVNQWQGAGLNKRLLALLKQKPILKKIEEQNKALHPTEGAVVPK